MTMRRHIHSVYDTDLHFIVDPITRKISSESGKVTLMQNDHNSERFTFEIPRYVEGHDMSLCNVVEVHYINVNSANKNESYSAIYPVVDLQISPDSDDMVSCSWLISQNCTAFAGTLNFILRYACVNENSEIEYQWFTDIYKGINIVGGIYNTAVETQDDDRDVLAAWKQEVIDVLDSYVGSAIDAAETAVYAAFNAKASEEAAAISESNAAISAANALVSEQNAKLSEIIAKESELISTSNAESTQFHHDQAKALNEASMDALEEARTTLEGVEHKIENTVFDIDFETGNLECISPNYTFDINEETGNLEGDVSDLGNHINDHIDEKVDAEFEYVKNSVDQANAAVEQLEKDFQIYVGDSGVMAEIQNEISELAESTSTRFIALEDDVDEQIAELASNMPELKQEVSSTFTKNPDGTMTTVYDDGRSEVFRKNPDGSLQTKFYYNGILTKTQVTIINSDGSIRTEITKGGAE